ncbi:hypothetical protein K7X08_020640 [Anisodus acutangulus]|uniref:Uncharacterized protein n=1 Tax=Anisodus acutangulus TaxID=402998 RepID=A0A9Q1MWJ2_9SOLA|nr:hypothetical protein K7X08_020640 [Anisodus acutangulus]
MGFSSKSPSDFTDYGNRVKTKFSVLSPMSTHITRANGFHHSTPLSITLFSPFLQPLRFHRHFFTFPIAHPLAVPGVSTENLYFLVRSN